MTPAEAFASPPRWTRAAPRDGVYQLVAGGKVLATIRRDAPGFNSHIAHWHVDGHAGHFLTYREAKAFVHKQLSGQNACPKSETASDAS